ncbi:hypothetical protein C8Q76DRAFT_696626 [Earliella scabrosa]|nr:hypothetical protein C8Q76DRAFT_696626 [Earliella scabrosa]
MSSQTYFMPIPRTSEAPCFNGRNLSKFMTALEHHLFCAKITDEDIRVNYIMRYSCEEIRRDIGHLSELDRSKTGKSWKEAKLFLLDFYGELDEDSPLTEFQKWVQTMADKPAFVSETQVNTYHTDFMSRSQPLLDDVQISHGDLCFAFIQGVPSSMKATLRHLIPAERRNRFTPYAPTHTTAPHASVASLRFCSSLGSVVPSACDCPAGGSLRTHHVSPYELATCVALAYVLAA